MKQRANTKLDWASLRPRVTDELLGDLAQRIVERFDPERILLFGSYAHGRPTLYSDVDILVIMESPEPFFERIRRVAEVAAVPFLPMDLIVRTPAEVEQRLSMGDAFLGDILSRGKVLYDRARRMG